MDRTLCLQTVQGANVMMGNWGGTGNETHATPIFINVRVKETTGPAGEPVSGEEIDLCFALTVPQMALIVKEFFYDIVLNNDCKNIFANMLRRLLRKRWAVMTYPLHKNTADPHFGDQAKLMQYMEL